MNIIYFIFGEHASTACNRPPLNKKKKKKEERNHNAVELYLCNTLNKEGFLISGEKEIVTMQLKFAL